MSKSIKFAYQDNIVEVVNFDENAIQEKLRPAVYSVGMGMQGFFLRIEGQNLNTPETLYGTVEQRANKILTSYKDTTSSFGVLLSGAKGAGKTMLSSVVANKAINELGLPVILVEGRYPTGPLSSFIRALGECVVFFDEFGKRFNDDEDEQDELLTLFDGSGSSKRMVLLTENRKYDINEFMLNRPGRIWYHFEYEKLEEEVVKQYCEAQGIDKETTDKITLRREMSYQFTFDTLRALVIEYKRYGGDIDELAADLNIETIRERGRDMMTILEITDVATGKELHPTEESVNFPQRDDNILISLVGEGEDEEKAQEAEKEGKRYTARCLRDSVEIRVKDLVSVENNICTFKSNKGEGKGQVLIRVLKENAGGYAY